MICLAYHRGVADLQRSAVGSNPTAADETLTLLELLVELTDKARASVTEVLTEFDLGPTAVKVLWNLRPGNPPPTMRSLAGRLACDPSTISLTADRLQAAGLVRRVPHPTDGRKRTLALTATGRELWTAVSLRLHDTSLLVALDPDERRALAALLAKALAGDSRARPTNTRSRNRVHEL
jgi:DNA-binding MarR family transcriptional regulator